MHNTEFDKNLLDQFGKVFFPAIAKGLISGYNVYHEAQKVTAKYLINYLHSDLGIDAYGKPQPHREELMDKLRKFGPAQITEKVTDTIVQSMATYKRGDWENDPPGVRYFTLDRRELKREEIMDYPGTVVVEGLQYDLGIALETLKEVNCVVDVLNKYTYAQKVDKDGTVHKDQANLDAIVDAWGVPLITITHQTEQDFAGFLPIVKIAIFRQDHEASTLTKNEQDLQEYLNSQKEPLQISRKLVNKVFINYL